MDRSERHDDHTGITHPILPNPPSVEAAYRQKCVMLKRRLKQVESTNEDLRLRNLRGRRYIEKMRLESCILLERLSVLMGMKEDVLPSFERSARTQSAASLERDGGEHRVQLAQAQAQEHASAPASVSTPAERDSEQQQQQQQQQQQREKGNESARSQSQTHSRRASKRSLNDEIMADADDDDDDDDDDAAEMPNTTQAAEQSQPQPPLPHPSSSSTYPSTSRRHSNKRRKENADLHHLDEEVSLSQSLSRAMPEEPHIQHDQNHEQHDHQDLRGRGRGRTRERDYEDFNEQDAHKHHHRDLSAIHAEDAQAQSQPLHLPAATAATARRSGSSSSRYVSAFEDFTNIYRAQVEQQLLEEYGDAREEDVDGILKRHWERLDPEKKRQFGDRRYDSR
ncbi:hypothetical protein KEM56_001292 [Ascosphaera pollenicola]|nr:hypothetical protein KEM56_001292 [Ascosphaera pollenicola]